MFQKPTFGSTNTSTFGSFNAGTSGTSPFGGFKPATANTTFGAPPAFGAAAGTQPATGGLFGASNTSGGLFGNTAASTTTPAFGSTTGGFGFGASTSTSGGLFANNAGTGLFGNTQTSAFGAKPAGFGFGSTATPGTSTGGLFGATPSTGTGLFRQPNTSITSGGLFSNTTGGSFGGGSVVSGTAHAKYSPVLGTDVVVKSGTSQNINIKHHCITCMKEYENKSLEELRLEDYQAGRKGAAPGGMFGAGFTAAADNKPLFGGTAFGQPATTTATSVFGTGALGTNTGFGQTSSFSFGNSAQTNTNTTGLFGAAKPAFAAPTTGGTMFGAATTQAPTFGTNTPSFGFGSNTQNQSTGIFGAKPATSGFGSTPSSGFGSFGTTNLFQAKPQQPPAFPAQQPAFGSLSGGFGTNTSTSGGLFNNSFGKPATSTPAFGFNTQPTLGTGLGTGLGANTQAKPAVGGFGTLGGSSLFQQPQQNNMLSQGGLGNMFGGNSTLGTSSLGVGMNANNTSVNSIGLSGSSAGGNVHEQILTLAARPYGESPLFKDLLSESSCAEEAVRPTNPAAVKALLSGARPTPPRHALRLQPRPLPADKKSLFDGLEESDASLEDKLSLKPSRKRLVLRSPNTQEPTNGDSRSEEPSQPVNGSVDKPDATEAPSDGQGRTSLTENNQEAPTEKNNSWLTSSKLPWNDKEKSIDNDTTPRIYPNLDKEVPLQPSERRASWLTTKPLRKPLVPSPDSAENSVRELGVRSPDRNSVDKENIDNLSVSEEEHVSPREMAPHPTGVKLTRPGYYTIPTLDDMIPYMRSDGSCVVPHLTIGRHNYGNVYYDDDVDVAGLDLDSLVHFMNKEVIVYPEEAAKPPLGAGLNRRAVVTLDRVWPRDKTRRQPITDPDRLIKIDYESKLRRVCDKHDTKFIEYRPQTGSWVFRVEHFSKYGLTDSDEEDDAITPDVLKRQLAKQALQKAAPVTGPRAQSPGGLGGLGTGPVAAQDSLFAMQQTSLNLLNGAGKAFDMDTTEDNGEAQSLYQDSRALGVKSPTSELARLENRQSHHVQLMKASLYADADMEDDISVSTGDQLVPVSTSPASTSAVGRRPQPDIDRDYDQPAPDHTPPESKLSPLLVQPHTIILQYHRRVPPFAQTIPGRLQASCLADMSICRARHTRVGFGPRFTLAYVTSRACLADLPTSGGLSDLGRYVAGRSEDDWSEAAVARLALANGDSTCYLQEYLTRHMETLLECSTLVEDESGGCGRLQVGDRRALLDRHLRCARAQGGNSTYIRQVWQLCDALWGADLDNDGIPGTDDASIVDRHRRLLSWLTDAVAETTDRELAQDTAGEEEDVGDGHSRRVWSLVVGGRVLDACRVARQHGDLNMALLMAQAAGSSTFRGLVCRQLGQWRECGAAPLIASHRLEALRLVAGEAKPLGKLLDLDWMRAFHATARYLCRQVPTLERVVQTYEDLFPRAEDGEQPSFVDSDEMAMKPPLPPYMDTYDVIQSGKRHEVLDLRYELLRARAAHGRPRLTPAAHTADPLDHSLCFFLGTWFGSPSVASITGMADQLEAAGLWHLAVAALLYHPHQAQRSCLVRGVVSRHAPAEGGACPRLGLLRRLRVPHQWLALAQAHRARYQHLPILEAQHLIAAEQWNAAHKVLMEDLLPEAVLSDDMKSIAPILESLNEAASRHEVSGWQTGGLALYHYMHLCEQVRGLASSEGEGLAALRPRAVAACRALQHLKPISSRHAAARTEMGGRLVRLCACGGVPPAALAHLLRALALPPATAAPALAQITTELAEHASDSCIESTTSSPKSSHHRTAVRS